MIAIWAIILGTIFSVTSIVPWLQEVSLSLTLQFAFFAMVMMGWCLWKQRFLWSVGMLLIAGWHGTHVWDYAFISASTTTAALDNSQQVRVYQHNIFRYYDHNQGVLNWLQTPENDYDIVVLQEVEDEMNALLPELKTRYPHMVQADWSQRFDNALLSKFPIIRNEIRTFPNSRVAYQRAVIALPTGAELVVYAVHTTSPGEPQRLKKRNAQLAHIAQEIAADNAPHRILIGDLNTTPYSGAFTQLVAASGLRDSLRGRGMLTTFGSFMGLSIFQSAIDHLLYSDGIVVLNKRQRPALWSDHYAVETTLGITAQQ